MQIYNTKNQYGLVVKIFHWLIALIVIGMLFGLVYLELIPKEYRPLTFLLHKSTGILILFLMVLRLFWRFSQVRPELPTAIAQWEKRAANTVHYLLYLFLILMPLSGWIMATAANKAPKFFGLFIFPCPFIPQSKSLAKICSEVHTVIAWVLVALITVHVFAALKHHFINKNDVLKKML